MRAADVTPAWIADILGVPEDAVDGLAVTTIGTGQVADTYRLTFTVGEAPRTLVAKMTSDDPLSRQTGINTADYLREVRFYSELAPSLPVRVPECQFAQVDDAGEEFVLVLSDLAPAAQGDQLAGCDVRSAANALRQAARLHAQSWDHAELLALPYLATPSFEGRERPDYSGLPDVFVERFPQLATPAFLDVARPFFIEAVDYLTMGSRAPRQSLVHGDFRLDNLLFDPLSDAVTVVDWQTLQAGCPLMDVAYFISTSFTPEDRRLYEDELLGVYHGELVAAGVTGYSLEECVEDYVRYLWAALWMGVAASLAVKQTDRGDLMFTSMAERGAAAMADHDTLRRTADLVRQAAPASGTTPISQ